MVAHQLLEQSADFTCDEAQVSDIERYLSSLMHDLVLMHFVDAVQANIEEIPKQVFDVLASRDFCYLSKTRVSVYREEILALVRTAVLQYEPIRFYFDIGGGYHASIRPGLSDLNFDAGLAELFVLSQITKFANRIRPFYPPGVRFSLVIDNMCALLINDIPLANTLDYCTRLRDLIRGTGLNALVDVLVESEHFSVSDFDDLLSDEVGKHFLDSLTRKEHENIERFLGRHCDQGEAFERAVRYKEVIDASEFLLAGLIHGVHMTQRATESTISFRPFPGGDSRIQCGEVALTRNCKERLCPVLLTSSSFNQYFCRRYRFPEILPSEIPHVTYAQRIAS